MTVVATGGAGKTRLAAEVARRAAASGRAVRVVELAGLRSPDEVLPAVLAAIGGPDASDRGADLTTERRLLDPEDRLRPAAQDLDGLVVLDNCEHVLDAAAAVVADLLAVASPDVAVLATSRAPLGLRRRGRPPAARPARRRRPRSCWRPAPAPAAPRWRWHADRALELCHRLDNLPLALELAAARLRHMPIEDVLAGLTDRFALLDDALRGLPERHASLWAMVDWSRELLARPTATLLQRLAVIPAPFTAEAAARVAARARTSRRGLATLVEQSLLTLDEGDGGPRATGCSRRSASTARRGSTPPASATRRWPGWSAGPRRGRRGRRATSSAPGSWSRSPGCAAEQDNLVAALRWAIDHDDEPAAVDIAAALFHLWTVRGLHVEVVDVGAAAPARRRPGRAAASRSCHGAAAGRPLPDADRLAWRLLSRGSTPASPTSRGPSRSRGGRCGACSPTGRRRSPPRCARWPATLPALGSTDLERAWPRREPHDRATPTRTCGLGLFVRAARAGEHRRLDDVQRRRERGLPPVRGRRRPLGHGDGGAGPRRVAGHARRRRAERVAARAAPAHGAGRRHAGRAQPPRPARRPARPGGRRAGRRAAARGRRRPTQADDVDVAQARLGLAQVALQQDASRRRGRARRGGGRAGHRRRAIPVPQVRVVFRVAVAGLHLRVAGAARPAATRPRADARGRAARAAAADALASQRHAGARDLGARAARSSRRTGASVDRARELWALGVRLGAQRSCMLFQRAWAGRRPTRRATDRPCGAARAVAGLRPAQAAAGSGADGRRRRDGSTRSAACSVGAAQTFRRYARSASGMNTATKPAHQRERPPHVVADRRAEEQPAHRLDQVGQRVDVDEALHPARQRRAGDEHVGREASAA